jgi:hypothetical protein
MISQNVTVSLIKSLQSRFTSERDEAMATIMVYLTNPSGIGEHAGIVDELDKLFSKAAEANEKLELLNSKFKIVSEENEAG